MLFGEEKFTDLDFVVIFAELGWNCEYTKVYLRMTTQNPCLTTTDQWP